MNADKNCIELIKLTVESGLIDSVKFETIQKILEVWGKLKK